jgi:hypothetical protein
MKAIENSDRSRESGTFLWGWGGLAAVLFGVAVPIALSFLIGEVVSLLERALVSLGTTKGSAVMTMYWLQFIGIGAGFAIVFLSKGTRMDALRKGVGDWPSLVREALVIASAVTLWVAANEAWQAYGDTFNTYGTATELTAAGLMVLIIAVSAIAARVRRRAEDRAARAPAERSRVEE